MADVISDNYLNAPLDFFETAALVMKKTNAILFTFSKLRMVFITKTTKKKFFWTAKRANLHASSPIQFCIYVLPDQEIEKKQ